MIEYDQIIHLDFESYYDREYSLKKMPTILYCRDPRFKTLGVAVAVNDGPHRYLSHEDFIDFARTVDWSRTAVSAYRCAFDGCVLTQHYGIYPAYYIDPLSAARALIPTDRHQLKDIAPLLGLGEKGDALVMGATESTQELADYACQDNELARGIYRILYPLLSLQEKDLIHLTIRQAVEPTLEADIPVMTTVRDDAINSRLEAIAASGFTDQQLSSNQQFAQVVRSLGLTPPTKISNTTGEETEAFAKGDDEFVEFMLAYPEHQAVWDGRLAAKSNINQTRAEKYLNIAKTGPLPMPLNYCGAHTGRWSGDDGLNVQNMPGLHRSNFRKAIKAPKGYVIVVVDSAQIELRVNMWFCGQQDKLSILAGGGDIYREEASVQFHVPTHEVTKKQRQFGKVVQLGCGFGMGASKFRKYCASGPMGNDPIYLSESQAYAAINMYRAANHKIPVMWYELDRCLNGMTLSNYEEELGYGVSLKLLHEGITLPSGRMLQYPGLHQTRDGSWCYELGKRVKFLWGGTMLENVVQAMARDIIAEQMLKIDERYRVVSSTHDEVLYLARAEEAEEALQFGLGTLSVPPWWAEDLPLAAEGGYDVSYSK